jgi:phosphohistidine phosphatase
MSRELLVFRHGKSDWDSEEGGDFGRPLSGRGHKAVKRMAGWLGDQDLLPDHILSSTALRAEQTTLGLCEHAGIPTSTITWTETIYEAGVSTLLTVLSEAGSEWGRLMIVGHNPGFESLVAYLTGQYVDGPLTSPGFPTAAIAHLAMPDDWNRLESGCASLMTFVRPRDLDI